MPDEHGALPEIYVDADGCPVRAEVLRVAERHGLMTYLVSDGGIRPHPSDRVRLVILAPGTDAADHWIAAQIGPGDIAITNDIPLADQCLKKGAAVLRPNGEALTDASIGMALASRALMQDLRQMGEVSGGPAPFSKRDRARFLQALDAAIHARR